MTDKPPTDVIYGKSPAVEILADVRARNDLSEDERVYATARVVEQRLGYVE